MTRIGVEEKGDSMAEGNRWRKAEAVQVERFHEAVTGIDGVEVRKMFGFPAAFIGGNLTAGLHQETVMVRLPDSEREERVAQGWSLFEPMPGRPMPRVRRLAARRVLRRRCDPAVDRTWRRLRPHPAAQGSEEKEGRLADPRGRRQIAEIRRGGVRGP